MHQRLTKAASTSSLDLLQVSLSLGILRKPEQRDIWEARELIYIIVNRAIVWKLNESHCLFVLFLFTFMQFCAYGHD